MEKLYPLQLIGVTKSPLWGGTRLQKNWNKSGSSTIGESWELTVRAQERCRVANGAHAGKELNDLIDAYGTALTGGAFGSENFPLLIKLIDAADALSVQVHPDDRYASEFENDRGKTEMWYIVEADEGAELVCGFSDGVTGEDFADAVKAGEISRVLKHQPVKAGETYFIPAGLTHAIGKGILIAEIQQNCDLTYRVYDYDRRGADGKLRELHIEKALQVARPFDACEIKAIRYAHSGGEAAHDGVLADCDYFRVEKLTVDGGKQDVPMDGAMRHLLCLSGKVTLTCDGEAYTVKRGDSYLLPASCAAMTLTGEGELLLSNAN